MKRKTVILCLCALLVALFCFCFSGCDSSSPETTAYVTIEVNPSIELIVDRNRIVLSINGLNDDGKVLLSGEELVGKELDEVVARISVLLEELGYVTKEKAQTMYMNVVTESEELKSAVQNTIEQGVSLLKQKCDMAVVIANRITREHIQAAVLKANPGMTTEQVAALSNAELMNLLKISMLEKAEFAFVYMEEQFYQLKEVEFKLKYYDEMKEMLDGVSGFVGATYNLILSGLQTGINELVRLQAAIYENQLESVIIIIDGVNVLDKATEYAVKSIQVAIDNLNVIIDQLDSYRQRFNDQFDSDELLNRTQAAINDAKDGFFARYEENFKNLMEEAKAKIAQYKAQLANPEA